MVDKFSFLGSRFRAMYKEGRTYSEIAKELGVNILTLREWRVKLKLPPRINRDRRSWMDVPTGSGMTSREMLQSIAKPLGITENDIAFILTRFDKLKSKGYVRGRRSGNAILAAAFMYLRWQGSGRRPVSTTAFLDVCQEVGRKLELSHKARTVYLGLSRSALNHMCRLFEKAGLYPVERLRPEELLERTWKSFQDKHQLPEAVKDRILSLIKDRVLVGRTASAIVAVCAYVACSEAGRWLRITEKQAAEFFGVTEVSVRNGLNCLRKNQPSLATVLGKGDPL